MAISAYIDFLKYEKRYSENTLKAYQNDIIQFFDFLLDEFGVQSSEYHKIEQVFIRDWISNLVRSNHSVASVNRKLSALKRFFHFLVQTEVLKVNPAVNISNLKKPKRIVRSPSLKELNSLWESDLFAGDYQGVLSKSIIATIYLTGMRRAELIGLRLRDIDWGQRRLKVLGKGNKVRFIPLSDELEIILKEYLEQHRQNLEHQDPNFFLTKRGKILYPKLVHNVVNDYLREITTLKKTSPHVLRHAFATHLLQQGAPLNAIKELLGHESLAATQVYTNVNVDRIKSVYNHTHPRNTNEGE